MAKDPTEKLQKGITCCRHCEDRWVKDGKTCHSTCDRYNKEKEEHEVKKEWVKKMSTPALTKHDFDKVDKKLRRKR